jgi:hypothetical protein
VYVWCKRGEWGFEDSFDTLEAAKKYTAWLRESYANTDEVRIAKCTYEWVNE